MKKALCRQLAEITGQENFSCDLADLQCYAYDSSGVVHLPEAVVLPASAEEVAKILALAWNEGIPVFPRGAGSGTTGASVPIRGGLVLSLTRMNRILALRPEDLVIEVEPGVVTGDIQNHVERHGLFYPPDPASLKFCTIGGNVATGAGGARAVKYGVTKDYVLGLEVVLPGGRLLRTGTRTAKGVVGYDLTRLMVGSEGTLGVATRIALRLIPAPEAVGTLAAFFPAVSSAMEAVGALFGAHILPRCAEFLDRQCLELIADHLPEEASAGAQAMLLVEVDGLRKAVPDEIEKIATLFREAGASGVRVASDPGETTRLWAARRSLSPSLKKLGFPNKISEDICVPRHALPELISRLEAIGAASGVTLLTFGHAGDGNLHVNVLLDASRPEDRERGEEAIRQIMDAALEFGGTISGEHGIGLTKMAFIEKELGPEAITLMKGIKRVFDPDNILNPGKIFPENV